MCNTNETINSPTLDLAWANRTKLRNEAMVYGDEIKRLKKAIKAELKKSDATSKKMASRAPWKVNGMHNKRRNILAEVTRLKSRSADLGKKRDKLYSQANNLWNAEVIRVCGDIEQNWVKHGDGYICVLENGLEFTTD